MRTTTNSHRPALYSMVNAASRSKRLVPIDAHLSDEAGAFPLPVLLSFRCSGHFAAPQTPQRSTVLPALPSAGDPQSAPVAPAYRPHDIRIARAIEIRIQAGRRRNQLCAETDEAKGAQSGGNRHQAVAPETAPNLEDLGVK
jgi:hypothetical protein